MSYWKEFNQAHCIEPFGGGTTVKRSSETSTLKGVQCNACFGTYDNHESGCVTARIEALEQRLAIAREVIEDLLSSYIGATEGYCGSDAKSRIERAREALEKMGE